MSEFVLDSLFEVTSIYGTSLPVANGSYLFPSFGIDDMEEDTRIGRYLLNLFLQCLLTTSIHRLPY
jgi:hypothetical protein